MRRKLVFKVFSNQNQQDMRVFFINLLAIASAALCFIACEPNSSCKEIQGVWVDREGHELIFQENGKALWLNRFGQMIDTVALTFELNCATKPASIDLKNFQAGPFLGKTLFGILEFSGDTLFRLCYETGQEPSVRPGSFTPDQTVKFFR